MSLSLSVSLSLSLSVSFCRVSKTLWSYFRGHSVVLWNVWLSYIELYDRLCNLLGPRSRNHLLIYGTTKQSLHSARHTFNFLQIVIYGQKERRQFSPSVTFLSWLGVISEGLTTCVDVLTTTATFQMQYIISIYFSYMVAFEWQSTYAKWNSKPLLN